MRVSASDDGTLDTEAGNDAIDRLVARLTRGKALLSSSAGEGVGDVREFAMRSLHCA